MSKASTNEQEQAQTEVAHQPKLKEKGMPSIGGNWGILADC